jgi:hypothetical protein
VRYGRVACCGTPRRLDSLSNNGFLLDFVPPPSGSPRFARGTEWGLGSVFPPPLGSPRFARGTNQARFPLLAGGTLRRGFGLYLQQVRPIAEPEFIIAPLLEVPPASRGEPSGDWVRSLPPSLRFPPLREGNRAGYGFGLYPLQVRPRFARGTALESELV